jgi:class 3 adenylate cyclase
MIMQKSPQASLPQVMGRWLEGGKEIVQRHGGCVNKFLGNGFLSYWRHSDEATGLVAQTARELIALQAKAEPPFRFVVHWGQVAFAASTVPGEEILMGQEVNRAFRMEKLAGTEGQSNLLSSPARGLLKPHIETFELGSFTLLGFRQPEMFFIL